MGARKARFTDAEKALLVPGARIEWQNLTQWHPVEVVSGPERDDLSPTRWHATGRTLVGTRTFSKGQTVILTPNQIRPITS
jgi:hypothetical protein